MASPFEQARDKLREAEQAVREFLEAVGWAIDQAPVLLGQAGIEIAQAARSALNDLQRKIDEFMARINQMLEQPGNADRLRTVARQWVDAGNQVGDIGGSVGLDQMRSNIEWEGRAAEAFKAMVPAQASNAATVKSSCIRMAGSLDALADQLDAFWTAMTAAIAIFAVGAVAAIAVALTVVGAPAAIASVAGAALVGGGLVTTTVIAMNGLADRINSEQNSIKQAAHDASSWPTPRTADLSDASVRDGDPSDWRPRQ